MIHAVSVFKDESDLWLLFGPFVIPRLGDFLQHLGDFYSSHLVALETRQSSSAFLLAASNHVSPKTNEMLRLKKKIAEQMLTRYCLMLVIPNL